MSGDTRETGILPAMGLEGLLARRDLLRVGAISVAASALPGLFGQPASTARAAAKSEPREGQGKAKSVIFLWMGGGVTHIDSFDPKPDAPVEVRGTLGDIATRLPGVRFCETLPKLAGIADKLAVLRSYSHDSDDHLLSQVYTLSGRRINRTQLFSEPNMGGIVWRLQGPRNGLPGYIAVPGITRPGPPPHNLFVGGWLGSKFAPYCLGGLPAEADFTVGEKLYDPPAKIEEDLRPKSLSLPAEIPLARLSSRRQLRDSFDQALRTLDRSDTIQAAESQYQNALRLLTTPEVRDAFAVGDEPDTVREAYGRTKIGGRCLTARRLVEAGARFVMVDYGYDPDYGNIWDNHNVAVQNHPPAAADGVSRLSPGRHRPGVFRPDFRSGSPRAARDHARRLRHRVRPHAADQQERRPRSLGQGRLALLHRRRHQDGPGRGRNRSDRGQTNHAPLRSVGRRRHDLSLTRHRPPQLCL